MASCDYIKKNGGFIKNSIGECRCRKPILNLLYDKRSIMCSSCNKIYYWEKLNSMELLSMNIFITRWESIHGLKYCSSCTKRKDVRYIDSNGRFIELDKFRDFLLKYYNIAIIIEEGKNPKIINLHWPNGECDTCRIITVKECIEYSGKLINMACIKYQEVGK